MKEKEWREVKYDIYGCRYDCARTLLYVARYAGKAALVTLAHDSVETGNSTSDLMEFV